MTDEEAEGYRKQLRAGIQQRKASLAAPAGSAKFVTPPCDLCSDVSVVMIRAPHGCTCLRNVYQRRCAQHLLRASDTLEYFEIVEDYTLENVFSPNEKGQR